MIRSRVRKIAIATGAGAVATVSALALSPFSANADPTPTATTTTVTAAGTVTTGRVAIFIAAVSPFKTLPPHVTKAGGTVSFTITGKNSLPVSCVGGNSALPLNGKGKAACKVAANGVLAAQSPYTVTATYTGATGFAGSQGVLSQAIGKARTGVKITYDAKPTGGSATTFTATVTNGSGPLPTGTVLFAVSSSPGANHKALKCAGGNNQPVSANGATPPILAVATCSLSSGWFKVASASKANPHPSSSWNVTAVYSGDGSYGASHLASKQGTSKV
jgi:hypothetical protein